MIEITTYVLGPLENNVYLLHEPDSGRAVIVDPAVGSESICADTAAQGLTLEAIWITHSHFDHIAGVNAVFKANGKAVPVLLHPMDRPLWVIPAWAAELGVPVENLPTPQATLEHGQLLSLGDERVEVRHAPGHSPGHVLFYLPSAAALLCGDVIFRRGIGRTDLQGGDYHTLIDSISRQVLTLPDGTRLLPGHGDESTVGEEWKGNPYLTW